MGSASIDLGSNLSLAGGTVTSVAMTVPSGFAISGSPLTTNGTLALSLVNGTRTTYVPVLDAGLTNSTGNTAKYWRVNGTLWVEGGFTMTGNGGATETLTIALPAPGAVQLLIDTAQLSTGTSAGNGTGPILGTCVWFQSGVAWRPLYPTYNTTSTIRFYEVDQIFAADQLNVSDGLHYLFSVPIVGW